MFTRKALWIPALVSAGLLIVLGIAGWSIDSSPVSSPTADSQNTSTTQSVSIVPTPDVADITVKTSTETTTTTTTTRQPKPPPAQQPPPVQQPTTTTEPPQQGLLVVENASCSPEGAHGIDFRGQQLICSKKNDRDRLRWQKV